MEITPRPLWLPCELRAPEPLPVHKGYEFKKLAAWRRWRKMRDLYDLYWFGQGTLDEAVVRRVLVLKVWHDVVDDGLGRAPFDPTDIVAAFDAGKLQSEEIGLLTQPVEPARWATFVCDRYRFLSNLEDDERRAARCKSGPESG